jgi:hypothetical protein
MMVDAPVVGLPDVIQGRSRAFDAHAGDPRQQEPACRIAWAAVKRSYVKIRNSWMAPGLGVRLHPPAPIVIASSCADRKACR